MKPVTLLILAAGMGTRYGGLKQLDPIGPNQEVILDYSVYDALKAGFQKVVFVIRKEFEAEFRKKISDKYNSRINIEFVFQTLDKYRGTFKMAKRRQKPWGTAHAILCAREAINEPFVAINADDFYGRESFVMIYDYLAAEGIKSNSNYCMSGYQLANTLSPHGQVSRGICNCNPGMFLNSISEHLNIEAKEGKIISADEAGKETILTGREIVSMNFWGFLPSFFDQLSDQFDYFLSRKGDQENSEFLISQVIDNIIKQGLQQVKVLSCDSKWFGVTYPQDKESAISQLAQLIDQGIYPSKLT